MKVGVLGLGNIGFRMAKNLLKKNYQVTVFDVRQEPMDALVKLGAASVASPAELGENADAVIVAVLNMQHVEDAVLEESKGLLQGMKKGGTVILCSTLGVPGVCKVESKAGEQGIFVIDAPISGGVVKAEEGTLTMMVSADEKVFKSCEEIIRTVGSNTIIVGNKVGDGQTVKATVQLLVSVNQVAIAEAMVLGAKAGIDPKIVFEVTRASVGTSALLESKMPRILKGDFSRQGALDIQIKDLDICLELGKKLNLPLFVAAASREVFLMANAMGIGSEDLSAVIKLYEQSAKVEVRE
jgi:2-hydroxymethylglutarate dehydrogenase